MEASPIVGFYDNRCVLVTGATGFMGRVLVEKLLRSCPGISTIYLLLRVKSGSRVDDRIYDIIDVPIFDELKKNRPQVFSKLVPIAGDITQDELGIAPAELEVLKRTVSVVFHLAARIKFDRNLKDAVEVNVKGARRILKLCRRLPLLQALIHVSTCYIHLDHGELGEEIYMSSITPQDLIDSVDNMTSAELQSLVDKLLLKCPNVYACTKAVGEQLLNDENGNLPLVIVRPSIVTAAWKEPLPGWIDNLNGPSGFIAGALSAFLRSSHCCPDLIGDMVPVDFPINLMIAAAWHKVTFMSQDISIFNCSAGSLNPMTWGKFHRIILTFVRKYPSKSLLWYPDMSMTSSKFLYTMEFWLYHYLPAYFFDALARLCGQRPKMVRMYDKAHRALSCSEFYTSNQWKFHANNLLKLVNVMDPIDKALFNCDLRNFEWYSYKKKYCLGVRQYVLKEDSSTLPAAKRKLKMFYWIRLLLRIVIFAAVVWIFRWMLKNTAQSTNFSILNQFSLF